MVMGTPRTCRAYPMHSLTRPARPARPLAMKAGAEGTERDWGARRVKGHGVGTGGPSPARNEVWPEEKSLRCLPRQQGSGLYIPTLVQAQPHLFVGFVNHHMKITKPLTAKNKFAICPKSSS